MPTLLIDIKVERDQEAIAKIKNVLQAGAEGGAATVQRAVRQATAAPADALPSFQSQLQRTRELSSMSLEHARSLGVENEAKRARELIDLRAAAMKRGGVDVETAGRIAALKTEEAEMLGIGRRQEEIRAKLSERATTIPVVAAGQREIVKATETETEERQRQLEAMRRITAEQEAARAARLEDDRAREASAKKVAAEEKPLDENRGLLAAFAAGGKRGLKAALEDEQKAQKETSDITEKELARRMRAIELHNARAETVQHSRRERISPNETARLTGGGISPLDFDKSMVTWRSKLMEQERLNRQIILGQRFGLLFGVSGGLNQIAQAGGKNFPMFGPLSSLIGIGAQMLPLTAGVGSVAAVGGALTALQLTASLVERNKKQQELTQKTMTLNRLYRGAATLGVEETGSFEERGKTLDVAIALARAGVSARDLGAAVKDVRVQIQDANITAEEFANRLVRLTSGIPLSRRDEVIRNLIQSGEVQFDEQSLATVQMLMRERERPLIATQGAQLRGGAAGSAIQAQTANTISNRKQMAQIELAGYRLVAQATEVGSREYREARRRELELTIDEERAQIDDQIEGQRAQVDAVKRAQDELLAEADRQAEKVFGRKAAIQRSRALGVPVGEELEREQLIGQRQNFLTSGSFEAEQIRQDLKKISAERLSAELQLQNLQKARPTEFGRIEERGTKRKGLFDAQDADIQRQQALQTFNFNRQLDEREVSSLGAFEANKAQIRAQFDDASRSKSEKASQARLKALRDELAAIKRTRDETNKKSDEELGGPTAAEQARQQAEQRVLEADRALKIGEEQERQNLTNRFLRRVEFDQQDAQREISHQAKLSAIRNQGRTEVPARQLFDSIFQGGADLSRARAQLAGARAALKLTPDGDDADAKAKVRQAKDNLEQVKQANAKNRDELLFSIGSGEVNVRNIDKQERQRQKIIERGRKEARRELGRGVEDPELRARLAFLAGENPENPEFDNFRRLGGPKAAHITGFSSITNRGNQLKGGLLERDAKAAEDQRIIEEQMAMFAGKGNKPGDPPEQTFLQAVNEFKTAVAKFNAKTQGGGFRLPDLMATNAPNIPWGLLPTPQLPTGGDITGLADWIFN